jgi:hypothetical protein
MYAHRREEHTNAITLQASLESVKNAVKFAAEATNAAIMKTERGAQTPLSALP